MEEIWKPINEEGFEGLYEISNYGNARSCERIIHYSDGRVRKFKSRILKIQKSKNGYNTILLLKNRKEKRCYIHRLVAKAFVLNPDNLPEVDHIIPISMGGTDEASNLRWVSRLQNRHNPLTEENCKGRNHTDETKQKISKAREVGCICIETGEIFDSITKAGKIMGLHPTTITRVCKGKQQTTGGYHFKYMELMKQ